MAGSPIQGIPRIHSRVGRVPSRSNMMSLILMGQIPEGDCRLNSWMFSFSDLYPNQRRPGQQSQRSFFQIAMKFLRTRHPIFDTPGTRMQPPGKGAGSRAGTTYGRAPLRRLWPLPYENGNTLAPGDPLFG